MKTTFLVAALGAGSLLYILSRGKHAAVQVDDDALIVRTRAKLEGLVAHPGSIDIQVREGVVTLHGPIAKPELRPALRAIRALPGVRRVAASLTVHH